MGNPTSITDALDNTYVYEYDYAGDETLSYLNPSAPENHIRTKMDIWGNTIEQTAYPNGPSSPGLTETYEYDIAGNLLSFTDPNGNETTMEYDAAGRLIKTTFPDGTYTTTNYNKFDTPSFQKQYSQEGEEIFSLVTVSDERGSVTMEGYKTADQLLKMDGMEADSMGQITQYRQDGGNIYQYSYDQSGNLTQKSTGTASVSSVYGKFGITSATATVGTSSLGYTYDKNGNIITKTQDNLSLSYEYDPYGRMTAQNGAAYTYDANDQITSITADGKTYSYEYNGDGTVKKVIYPTV